MKYYIAGPMTGYVCNNFPSFDNAKAKLLKMGQEVVSPADIARTEGWLNHDGTEKENDQPPAARDFVKRDLDHIYECNAMYMLKGWEKSVGARAEHAVAVWLGLEIMYE